jgi:hypothetical protein
MAKGPKEMMGPGYKMPPKQGDWVGRGYHLWRRRVPWGEGGPREMMRARAKMFIRRRWPKENVSPRMDIGQGEGRAKELMGLG